MNNIIKKSIKEGEVKQMRRNKKKKGFTLVELIAVIAILGILAMIVVPKISNYTSDARKNRDLANAKTIAQAVEMYNTEHEDKDQITEDTPLTDVKDALIPSEGKKYLSSWPKDITWKTYGDVLNHINNASEGSSK